MFNSLQLDAKWRDWVGIFDPPAVAQVAPIATSACYRPRWQEIPSQDQQVVPDSGKIDYTFYVKPGSIIFGLVPDVSGTSVFQLTDIALGHQFFQDPINGVLVAEGPDSPTGITMLATPHPVTGAGLFRVEIWATVGQRVPMFLLIAEANECEQPAA